VVSLVGETLMVPLNGLLKLVPLMLHDVVLVHRHESADDSGGIMSVGLAVNDWQDGPITVNVFVEEELFES